MTISFKISKKGTRFQPKPKPETSKVLEEDDDVDVPPQIPKNQSLATTRKLSVDAEKGRDNAEISGVEVSFFVSLFPDGYAIGNPNENEVGQLTAAQDDPKFMHPYDRTSESLFLAIECGQLPADFLDDIPLKYFNGAVFCEVRDYRECTCEPGGNPSPKISKVRLKMTLENVVKDISQMSDSSWTYGDLMEAEARILLALQPKLDLDPTPNLDRLCEDPTVINLNLDISGMRRKRLRQMSEATTASDNAIQGKKVCMDRVPENSTCRLGDSGPIVQLSDFVNPSTQNIGPSNMLASRPRTFSPDTSVPASPSVSHQSKYQIGVGNPRVMQDHGSGPVFGAPGASPGQDMMNAYTDNINSSVHGKRDNQDGPLSPMANLNKRARPNSMGLDGSQQQQIASHSGFNAPADSHWKNTLMQQQPIGRGIQYPNAGMQQKYPQQMFEGSFNQEGGAMPFTMGQPGMRYNLKQEPVESERSEVNRSKNEMNMVDSETNHDSQQSRLQQRLPQQQQQQFTRSSFPQTTWNNLGQPLENNSRKEEQFQRRKSAQSPRVSAGGLPQSPLSSKSGEFSSGSLGGTQFGVAAIGSSQREKSAVTSVPAVGSLTSSANDSMQRQHQAQMAVNRRSNSLPKTPAMTGVGSPASVSNMSGPFNASSPVGKEADKILRDRFSKIEMLTARHQLNCKKNKIDEYKKVTAFPTQQLNHCLFNDHNNDNLKDETCKMPLSKSVVGGSMNICKTRVLSFRQNERVIQGNGFSIVTKSRTRLILSEKPNEGTVAMHYGEWDECDYLAEEECLPTLPTTHVADLLAAQFCSLILREGYDIEGDHLQPKKINTGCSGSQPNNSSAEMQQTQEAVSGQPSNEAAKPSISGTNSGPNNMAGARMHPPSNSQAMQISQGGLLPGGSRPTHQAEPSLQQQQQQHSMMQQLQRSPAMMLGSNPLSHLNAMGQNSNMQQQFGHMLNKVSPLQLQLLHQQQPQMQRKMMMGLGNNMVGLQGLGNVMGMAGGRGISPPMSGSLSPMNNNINQNQNQNQNPMNVSQASNISNVISQQFRPGQYTPVQAALMATKLRMAQNRSNMMGGAGGQSSSISGLPGANRQMHPGSSGLSMLGPSINRANTMNPMQRTAMAPPKLTSSMNLYMNQQQQQQQQQLHLQQQMQQQQQLQQQHQQQQQQQQQQETTSPLQAVLSPPQQVGSPSMGMASPQQMSQRTPMSPQLSSGAIHPPMSAGNQEGNCPASPQLSSQTIGSVSSHMANSPMELQGVNKSG